MKASFLTVVIIWVCLSLIAGESYACKTPPLPEIVSPYIQNVCIGTDVEFDGVGSCVYETGSHDPDNESPYGCGHGINTYYWHYGDETGEPYWHDDGGEPNHIYHTAGTYTVELKVKDDDNVLSDHNDTCTVYVVKVEKVVKYGTTDEGPLYTYLEGGAYLEAKPYPAEASFPEGTPTWSIKTTDPPGLTASLTPCDGDHGYWAYLDEFSAPGEYVIEAKCGDDDEGDTITVIVVEPNLNIEDVPDDDEEDPGGYVSFNNDDDNDNGTPDKDDETVTVDGEDNLVEISLSVLPSLSTGEVELRLDDYPFLPNVRVWSSPTKGEGNMIIPDDANYYKEWPVQSMPTTLYVEGISPSWPRADTLWLSYKRDGATITWDTVKFTVLEVELFRNSSYSLVLDDWPKDGDQLRSPKYIFGEDDPIYVEVDNLGRDDQTAESFSDLVWVTSESDTSDTVKLKLQETGPSTQVFNNSEPLGELLYLSTSSSEGDGDKIEVIDEEKLTFWLQIQPGSDNYVTCKTVMVDRGEFLAVAGSECGVESGWEDFNMAISDANTKMSNDYGWWQNGYMEGKYYETRSDMTTADEEYEESKESALDAGCVSGFSCADFSFYSGHGDDARLDIIVAEPDDIDNTYFGVSWYSTVLNPDRGWGWSDDIEFIVWSSCKLLGNAETPDQWVDRWIEEFFNKKLHAVLGTCDDIRLVAMNDDFGRFINKLKSGQTVVNAYKLACYIGWDSPYGILVRESNLNDYVLTPVSSAGQCLTRDYTNIDTTFYYFYYDGNQKIINPARNSQHISESEHYYIIKRTIAEAMEFKEEIQIDNLSVDEAVQPLIVPEKVRSLFEHTSMKEQSFSGWNKVEDSNIIRHTVKIAEAAARDHLASLGLEIPPDYALNSMGNMMVDRYIPTQGGTHQLGETWCEGQTFEFIREYKEQKIFDDRCKIAVQNKNVISYSLTKHLLKKTGTMIVKKPQFRFKDSFIKQDDLQTSIVYRLRGKTVYPVWQIQYHNYIFHYDLE